MRAEVLLGAVLLAGVSALAQDDSGVPEADTTDRIVLQVKGHAESIAKGVTLEYIVRGEGSDGEEAIKRYNKRIASIKKGLLEEAPVTSSISVDVTTDKKVTAAGFVFKMPSNGQQQSVEPGTTFSSRLSIAIRGIDKVSPDLARRRLTQIMNQIGDNALTGAEDDVDIMMAHMDVDREELSRRAFADALAKARRRASGLARLSQRTLGKVSCLREIASTCNDEQQKWTSQYFYFVFPGSTSGWMADMKIAFDTELLVEFELE